MFDTIYIFVPGAKQIIRISEGSGDNLLEEDIKAGFVDYIYYEQYDLGPTINEADGGQIMLYKAFQKQYTSTKDCIPDVLEMAYGIDGIPYIVLE